MSFNFESVTLDVNYKSGIEVAKKAKAFGVKSFVFALLIVILTGWLGKWGIRLKL